MREVAKLFYIFLTTPDEIKKYVQSSNTLSLKTIIIELDFLKKSVIIQ